MPRATLDQVAAHFDDLTASIIATMPALTASGRVGQAPMTVCSSSSTDLADGALRRLSEDLDRPLSGGSPCGFLDVKLTFALRMRCASKVLTS